MKNGTLKKILFYLIFLIFFLKPLSAEPTNGNFVYLQVLDKITSRLENINIAVGDTIDYGTLEIKIYSCLKRPPEEIPEDFVLLKIYDKIDLENKKLYYQGWMISSSPSVTPFEHPTYDIWVNDCLINKDQ